MRKESENEEVDSTRYYHEYSSRNSGHNRSLIPISGLGYSIDAILNIRKRYRDCEVTPIC